MGVVSRVPLFRTFNFPASLRFVSRYIDFLLMFLDYGSKNFFIGTPPKFNEIFPSRHNHGNGATRKASQSLHFQTCTKSTYTFFFVVVDNC